MTTSLPEVTGKKGLSARHLVVLQIFPSLPDDAVIADEVVAALTGLCTKTIRQHPDLPPIRVSRDRIGRRAGNVRKVLRGEVVAA